MSWFYRQVARPLLFLQDSESVHHQVLGGLSWAARNRLVSRALASFQATPSLPVTAFGCSFPNPLGLAAGMDKEGVAVPVWEALGFGFCELGGVTQHAQPGNPLPRMFRAVPDEALINRMGFNNKGADDLARCLAEWRTLGRWPRHPVGINLGKSKITPLDQAAADYADSFTKLRALADFFVVNVSSPNTPNLRQLQDRSALEEILLTLQAINHRPPATASDNGTASPKPILVKVSPDLSWEALDDIVSLAGPCRLAGIVATNTTITRPAPTHPKLAAIYAESGGLSGRPLRQRSTEVIRHLYRQTGGSLPIIGVGGISTVDDAWEKVTAGASLLQIYSSLVYHGPGIVPALVRGLKERAAGAAWASVVGSSSQR